jgi:hypothetical protein
MIKGMARRAKAAHRQLDGAALNDLVTAEVMRLPADHLVQKWLQEELVREEVQEEVERYLEEQVAKGRYERHPSDPDRYRLAQPPGTPWE